MLVISSIIHKRRQWDAGFVKMFNIFTQFLHRGHTSSNGIDIYLGEQLVYLCIYYYPSIFNLSWWKTNFYIHVCMFSILHGNNNDSFNTEDQFFFISNPDPNKLQRSSWLNLLVNIYLLHRLLWHGLLICYHQIKYELLIWC